MLRVVVGVDGSTESLRAVAWVAKLATTVADLKAITVGVYGIETEQLAYSATFFNDDFLQEWSADLQRHLESDWTQPLRDAGVQPSIRVEEGRVDEVICRVARDEHADLIVVGSRGRGHLRGMFLGSVSHALAIHAPCPVVILPHEHGHAAAKAA